MVIVMTTRINIRPAPNGKFYVVLDGQPVCDAAGGLLYFDDKRDVQRFLQRRRTAPVLDLLASRGPTSWLAATIGRQI
jgi:hypothetical protein